MNKENLYRVLYKQYHQAVQSGELIFTPSRIVKVKTGSNGSLPLIIRHAPQLGQKDKSKSEGKETQGQPHDPFSPPYPTALHLTAWGDSHQLLLNKFAICPAHFLVITNQDESQTKPLYQNDLVATWRAMEAMVQGNAKEDGSCIQGVLAFYNSGPNSGASQVHKHIQVIPFAEDQDLPPVAEWLATAPETRDRERVYSHNGLPFANYIIRLDGLNDTDDAQLGLQLVNSFHACLEHTIETFRAASEDPTQLSYNVLIYLPKMAKFTSPKEYHGPFMMLIPRSRERPSSLPSASINALGYAGMILAKSDQDLETLLGWKASDKQDGSNLIELLAELGFR